MDYGCVLLLSWEDVGMDNDGGEGASTLGVHTSTNCAPSRCLDDRATGKDMGSKMQILEGEQC